MLSINKYNDFKYADENIIDILSINLNKYESGKLDSILKKYYKLGKKRIYEPIIKDLYILAEINKFSTSNLASIYNVTVRTIQVWLKELGLNRDLKTASKLKNNSYNKNIVTALSHYKNNEKQTQGYRKIKIKDYNKFLYVKYNEELNKSNYCLYRFLDKNNKVLYVGKCEKSINYYRRTYDKKRVSREYYLIDRLRIHFNVNNNHLPKEMYNEICSIEYCVFNTKEELLVAESDVILYLKLQHQCVFNRSYNSYYLDKKILHRYKFKALNSFITYSNVAQSC